jgi:hypothetical protein
VTTTEHSIEHDLIATLGDLRILQIPARGAIGCPGYDIQTLTEVIQPAACRWQATGPLLASLATVWARFKAGLAWRGYLLAFCRVQEK